MSRLDIALRAMRKWTGGAMKTRLQNELLYACEVSRVNGGAYDALIEGALSAMKEAVKGSGTLTDDAVLSIEQTLMPMAEACKKYRLLMVGHAHIDMNWMWRYDETVSITLDTFQTALNLMKEFPKFTFSQSQASTYRIVEQYEPAMLEEIKERIKAGQWEVTATTWVEADRNMPSAESVARHHLYTKRYLPELLGIDETGMNLDYEPDTFGHHANVPEMLSHAGVKFYYHCRGADKEILYNWQSPSGAEILVYREPYWYLGPIDLDMAQFVPGFCAQHGMDTAMRVYGVGDHGGGPTRRDLERITDMGTWPIFPRVEFGTYSQFYESANAARENFPVIAGERNFVFTGCYTTQTRIKMGNRMGEKLMLEAEGLSAFAHNEVKAAYDRGAFQKGWEKILFNQFHDIIPGSGVVDTREHAMGWYQEAYAIANSAKREACLKLAETIDTSSFVPSCKSGSTAEGAGAGFGVYPFKLGQLERGGGNESRIFHLFNPLPMKRKEVTEVVLWDFQEDLDRIEIIDSEGNVVRHQVVDARFNHYWQHEWAKLLIEAELPALGYATYGLRLKDDLPEKELYRGDVRLHWAFDGVLENEHIRAEFDGVTGELISLVDKATGTETVKRAGFRFILESTDRGMTSWTVGRYMHVKPVTDHTVIRRVVEGELMGALSFEQTFERSRLTYTVSLAAGAKELTYDVQCDWLEVGNEQNGIPQLNFGVKLEEPQKWYLYDIPGGAIVREAQAMDRPSQGMIAAKMGDVASVLRSDCKYGFRGDDEGMSVTLIRSSYDPDPFPELGAHTFRLSVGVSHAREHAQLVHEAQCWNHPATVVSGSNHEGVAPLRKSFAELCGEGMVFTAAKLCEDDSGLIVRANEVNGEVAQVALRFSLPVSKAVIVDSLERPEDNAMQPVVEGNVVRYTATPFGQVAVKVFFQ